MARSLPAYSTGTVTVAYTGGAWTVTGSGTNFISPDGVANYTLVAGDMFVIPGVGFSPISSVNSASSLTLSNWTGGAVAAGTSYTIYRFEGLPSNQVAGLIAQLLTLFTDTNPSSELVVDTGAVRTKWDDDGVGNARMRVRASSLTDASYVLAARVNDATGVWQVPAIVGARVAVSDANYSLAAGVSTVAYTAITAARTVTLPAASSFAPGQQLLVVDESGGASATKTITLAPNGGDTINGAASAAIAAAYGYLALESNGSNAWTIVDSGGAFVGDTGSGGSAGFVPAPPSGSAASNEVLGAGGSWVGRMAGFRNRIINGAMAIDQRNNGAAQTISSAGGYVYTIDRFYAACAGANVTGQRIAGSAPDQYRYQLTGAASVSAIGFGQRIETANSFDLAGTTATLSVKLANTALTAVSWTAYYANAADNFSSQTQFASGAFTVNSTLTKYSAQIAIPAAATTGINIYFNVGAQTSGTWTIGEMQLEAGQAATPFERRPYGAELALCQRYLPALNANGAAAAALCVAIVTNSTTLTSVHPFPITPRVTPTGIVTSAASGFITGGPIGLTPTAAAFNANSGLNCGLISWTVSGATPGQSAAFYMQSTTAQILFTGCEL